jgi:hypothetical protein
MRNPAWLLALAALAGSACDNPNAGFNIVPLRVEHVEVAVLESSPLQIEAVVVGTLPTACSTIDGVSQRREGNVVEVTVLARTRRQQVCIAVLRGVTQRVRLDGTFPPGEYVLRANGVESRFRV